MIVEERVMPMNSFKLQAGDILIDINDGKSAFSLLKRWAIGPYDHASLYLGMVRLFVGRGQEHVIKAPMLFESVGRGVVLRSLFEKYSDKVVVMRLKSEYDRRRIPHVLAEAIKLASDPESYYDYLCIPRFVLPRLICQKLGLPIPLSWRRDPWHTCAEAVFEAFYRAKLVAILPRGVVPLPGDFVSSLLLEEVWRGQLSEEIV